MRSTLAVWLSVAERPQLAEASEINARRTSVPSWPKPVRSTLAERPQLAEASEIDAQSGWLSLLLSILLLTTTFSVHYYSYCRYCCYCGVGLYPSRLLLLLLSSTTLSAVTRLSILLLLLYLLL